LTSTPSRAAIVIADRALVGDGDPDPGAEVRDQHAGHPVDLRREERRAARDAERRQDEAVGDPLGATLQRHRLGARALQDLDDLGGGRVAPHAIDLDDDLPIDDHRGREDAIALPPDLGH
jgi:hypothetical protein